MSSSDWTFKTELDILEDRQKELKESYTNLRNFILSDNFLVKKTDFEMKLSDFEDKVVSLVETVEAAPPIIIEGQPQQQQQPVPAEMQREIHEERMSSILVRAILVAVAIIAAGILEMRSQMVVPVPTVTNGTVTSVPTVVSTGYVPPGTLQWVAIGTILIVSMPWIMDAARRLIEEARKEKPEIPELSVDWVHSNLDAIRQKYLAAWLLVKVQNQTKEDLPQYETMGLDEVLYSRIKYLSATLPTEFLSILGKIVIACDRAFWIRKGLLITAIVQSKAAVGRMR